MNSNVIPDEQTLIYSMLKKAFNSNSKVRVSAEVYTTNPNFPRIYGDCIITRDFLNKADLNYNLLNNIKLNCEHQGGFIFYVGAQWTRIAKRVPVLVYGDAIIGYKLSGIDEGSVQ